MEHTLEMTLDPIWDTVDRLHTWLDQQGTGPAELKTLLGPLTLREEGGEVSRAVVGAACPAR
ncbi:hypothetical protein ABZ348_20900 [Streptomyces sp. NPDC005963]|uniref:hypothetical protein n=1 Tax=Streptomyces sp. NPDC005963 TaxID=3156721 RepID=UPI0033D2AD90